MHNKSYTMKRQQEKFLAVCRLSRLVGTKAAVFLNIYYLQLKCEQILGT